MQNSNLDLVSFFYANGSTWKSCKIPLDWWQVRWNNEKKISVQWFHFLKVVINFCAYNVKKNDTHVYLEYHYQPNAFPS